MMNFRRIGLLWLLTLLGLWAFLPTPQAATNGPAKPAAPRDADAALIQLRMKRYNQEVGLTDKQHKTIQGFVEEETKRTTRVAEDESLSVPERNKKLAEIRKETYAKIKPLLTEEQVVKWEQMMAKPDRRKKKK